MVIVIHSKIRHFPEHQQQTKYRWAIQSHELIRDFKSFWQLYSGVIQNYSILRTEILEAKNKHLKKWWKGHQKDFFCRIDEHVERGFKYNISGLQQRVGMESTELFGDMERDRILHRTQINKDNHCLDQPNWHFVNTAAVMHRHEINPIRMSNQYCFPIYRYLLFVC